MISSLTYVVFYAAYVHVNKSVTWYFKRSIGWLSEIHTKHIPERYENVRTILTSLTIDNCSWKSNSHASNPQLLGFYQSDNDILLNQHVRHIEHCTSACRLRRLAHRHWRSSRGHWIGGDNGHRHVARPPGPP